MKRMRDGLNQLPDEEFAMTPNGIRRHLLDFTITLIETDEPPTVERTPSDEEKTSGEAKL